MPQRIRHHQSTNPRVARDEEAAPPRGIAAGAAPSRRLDHLSMIRSVECLERAADAVAETTGFGSVEVAHETDGACCRIQPWAVTLEDLLGAVARRRAGRRS